MRKLRNWKSTTILSQKASERTANPINPNENAPLPAVTTKKTSQKRRNLAKNGNPQNQKRPSTIHLRTVLLLLTCGNSLKYLHKFTLVPQRFPCLIVRCIQLRTDIPSRPHTAVPITIRRIMTTICGGIGIRRQISTTNLRFLTFRTHRVFVVLHLDGVSRNQKDWQIFQ